MLIHRFVNTKHLRGYRSSTLKYLSSFLVSVVDGDFIALLL